MLLQNVIDPTKHDLISYKTSNNIVYKAEDIYSGSSTEASLGTLTASVMKYLWKLWKVLFI